MGVIDLFSTVVRTDITASSVKINFQEKMRIDHFLLDFNSIIHVSSMYILIDVTNFLKQVLKNLFMGRSMTSPALTETFTKYKMSSIQKKILPKTDPKEAIQMFNEHFTPKYLDKLIIGRVIKTVIQMVRTHCINDKIKTLLLAIDGVPSKGKMLEQRQRRYMGAIMEQYKKKIFASYADYLAKQPDNLLLSESFVLAWSRNNITPGTAFMHKLVAYLRSEKIQSKIRNGMPHMQIIISDMYEVGEGEKKIMNYIHANLTDTKETVVVYSPDADVVLLCMLLPIKSIYVFRYSQQDYWTDLIDITMLKGNIAYYINNHPAYAKSKFDTDRINYDIVCLSTLFGNDFVPKIETISVKTGFQNIMEAYLTVLLELKSKDTYLVEVPKSKKDKFKLNLQFLQSVLKKLLPIENDFIKHNDVYNKYVRARVIKNTFSYMEINMQNVVGVVTKFRQDYENFCHMIRNNQNLTAYESHEEFMQSVKACIKIEIDHSQVNVTYLSNKELINLMRKQIRQTKRSPRLMINLDTKSRSITDKYHQNQIKQKEQKLGRPYNSYDKELYKFEFMLDQYQVKFNATELLLSEDRIKPFYKTYFGVNLADPKGKLSADADQIMRDYLEGLIWVFEYYYNDRSYVNTWYYKHEKAPLLRHLSTFVNSVKKEFITEVVDNMPTYIVTDLKTFFNPIEQLIYVSPMTKTIANLLPSNYRNFIQSDDLDPFLSNFFTGVEQIVSKLWKETVSTDIDCRSQPYLTKCIVSAIHKPTKSDDKQFLKQIRKVEPTDTSKRRSKCRLPPY